MTWPNDNARCHGQTVYEVCAQRETCRRFLEPPINLDCAWYIHPQIPGPCIYFMQAATRAPSEEEA